MKQLKVAFYLVVVLLFAVPAALSFAAEPLQHKITPAPASSATPAPPPIPAKPELAAIQTGRPDLIIEAIRTGAITRVEDRVEIPYSVRVYNKGGSPAGIFKVAVRYKFMLLPTVLDDKVTAEGVVPFTVPGQHSAKFPFTSGPLAAGSDVTFTGNLSFPTFYDKSFDEETPDARIIFEAYADSTAGDGTSVPDYGRVVESDENNNKSDPIIVEMSITRGPADK